MGTNADNSLELGGNKPLKQSRMGHGFCNFGIAMNPQRKHCLFEKKALGENDVKHGEA